MPRYRFSWDHVPDGVLALIGPPLGLEGDLREAMRSRFGARPRNTFVIGTWTVLRDNWLANDAPSRRWVIGKLKAHGLGDLSVDTTEVEGQMAYLRSCRNHRTLQMVVATAFRELGEPSASGVQQDLGSETSDDLAVDESLVDWIERVLTSRYGEPVEPDIDGEMPVPRGASVTYVRVTDDSPVVEVHAPVLAGMRPSSEIFQVINEINLSFEIVKAMVTEDGTAVEVQATVPRDALPGPSLARALDEVARAADRYVGSLMERFGGTALSVDDAIEEPEF